jgi:arginine:ornithine antiporter/lysine permease
MAEKSVEKKHKADNKIGLLGLVGVVVSAMVGGGVFNLPASITSGAGLGAILLGWAITGLGMWFIVTMFRILAVERPELTNGLFAYAKEGFGRLMGFLVAYGYWICSCCATAVYGILVMATLGTFFPAFEEGVTLPALIGSSCIVWIQFLLAQRGAHSTSVLNLVGTICKIVPLIIYIVAFASVFSFTTASHGFWGMINSKPMAFSWDAFGPQVLSTMLVTLWVFIGVEGAVVISGNADSQADVAKATGGGFLATLVLYVVCTVLPFGVLSQEQIASLPNPSVAAMMRLVFGDAGTIIVSVGILISVLSSWLAWTLMLGQMPTTAAEAGIFPPAFTKRNRHGAPTNSLLLTSCGTQALLIFAYFAGDAAWLIIINVTSVMALPCYLLCTLFLIKCTLSDRWDESLFSRGYARFVGVAGSIYAAWLVYAAGVDNLLMAFVAFAIGLPLFVQSVRAHGDSLKPNEKVVLLVICAFGIASLVRFVLF